jgi:hypothetical protein
MSPARILIYGRDSLLLNSRRMVLQHAGYNVTASSDLHSIRELLTSQIFEIFVVCHTLSAAERESALAISHALHPRPLNLILNTASSHYFGGPEDEITAFCDPESFVATVSELYSR